MGVVVDQLNVLERERVDVHLRGVDLHGLRSESGGAKRRRLGRRLAGCAWRNRFRKWVRNDEVRRRECKCVCVCERGRESSISLSVDLDPCRSLQVWCNSAQGGGEGGAENTRPPSTHRMYTRGMGSRETMVVRGNEAIPLSPPHTQPHTPTHREVAGRVLELLLQGVHVVGVDVGVAHHVHELAGLQAAHLWAKSNMYSVDMHTYKGCGLSRICP